MPILRRARAKGADADDVRSDLPQGTLDLLILKVLAPEPLHGYAIAQRLQQVSRDVVQVQQGTLYPALHRLEQRGYLTASWKASDTGRDAKFYRLTKQGQAQLESGTASWERLADRHRPDPPPGRRPAMTWFGRFRRRAALDRDLDRELQDHLERRTQALIAAGLTPAQARRQALVESGGAEQVKEAVRDVRGTRWAHDFAQDVRYGVAQPAQAARACWSRRCCRWASASAPTPRSSRSSTRVLLRALPVRAPAASWSSSTAAAGPTRSGRQLRDRTGRARSPGALAWGEERLDLSNGGETDPVDALMVSGSFFETLGVPPGARPAADAGRRSARRRRRRPDGGDQRALLGAPLPRRSRRRRPHAGDRAACRSRSSASCRRASSARSSAARSTSRCRSARSTWCSPGGRQSRSTAARRGGSASCSACQPGQSIDAATAALRGVQPQIREATLPRLAGRDAGARYLNEPLDAGAGGRPACPSCAGTTASRCSC